MNNNEFWLIFRNGDHIVSRLLKNGFGHISVLMKDQYNWLLLDPTSTRLTVTILPFSADQNVPDILTEDKNVSVVHMKTKQKKPKLWVLPWNISCIGIVKYITGIRGFFLTPYRLYKSLINNNLEQLNRRRISYCSEVR